MTNEQSREQLVAELAALRLRIQSLESRGNRSRGSADTDATPSAAEKLLRDSADGMFGVDAEGRVIFFNAAASSVTGWPLDDALGASVANLLAPARSDIEHPVASVLRHGATEHYENLAFIANDGSEIDLRLNVAPLLVDGAIAGAVGSFSLRDAARRAEPADLSITQFDALLDISSVDVNDDEVPFKDVAEALLDPLVVAAGADRAVLLITEQPDGELGVLLLEAPQGSLPPGPEHPPSKRKRHTKAVANESLSVPQVGDVGVNALVALPLKVGGRVAGMLSLVSSHEDHFNSARVAMLTTAVERLSHSCERRVWARESERLTEGSETMFALLRILAGQGGGSNGKAGALLKLAAKTVGGKHAALVGPDRPGGQLRWLAGGPDNDNLDPSSVAHSVAGRVQTHKAA
ncbi:MAG: PAS domain-containing protein, partial [Chloroflexi bacterium]|nr:PAS domain-containing protein [Chloroflexota bacterium]